MADVEKFVLKIEVDGTSSIDNLVKKIDDVDSKAKNLSGKKISISGDSSGIKSMQSHLDKLTRSANDLSNKKINLGFGDGGGGLSLLSGELDGLLGGMGKFAGPAGMVASGVLAVGAAGAAAALNLADMSREVSNLAAISGTDTDTFQRMAAGAKSVGVESDKLADIYKDVNDKVGDFMQTGGGEMKDFFENIAPKVGVTADEFRNLSGPDALQLYASTLQKAGANQQDVTFYMESLADEASALYPLLKDNGKGMKDLGDRASELGGIIDKETIAKSKELKTAMDDLGVAATALGNDFGSAFTPAMIAVAQFATQAIANFRRVLKEASLFKQNLAGALDSGYVEGQGAYDTSVQDAMLEQERDAAAKAAARAKAAAQRKGIGETWTVTPPPKESKGAKRSGGGSSGKSKALAEAEKLAKEAERERDAMIKSAKAAEDMVISMRLSTQSRVDSIDLETELIGLGEDEADLIRNKAKLRKDEADAILKLEKAIKDELEKASPNLVAIDTFKTGIEDAKKSTDAIVKAQGIYNDKLKASKDRAKELSDQLESNAKYSASVLTVGAKYAQAAGVLYGRDIEIGNKTNEVFLRQQQVASDQLKQARTEFGEGSKQYNDALARYKEFVFPEKSSDPYILPTSVTEEMQLILDADEAVRNSMIAGWQDAFSQIAESMTPFNLAAQAANDLWGQMSSSIDTAVSTGIFEFSKFRDSVIADIAKMMAKALASKLIGTLLGTATSVVTGAVTGGLTGNAGLGLNANLGRGNDGLGIRPRAGGGSVGGGNSYLVGERGPELFMPGQNGTVIPNRNLTADTKPQVVNNYTYNVSAVDGQSVARFFMENKNMVAAANRQATKERS